MANLLGLQLPVFGEVVFRMPLHDSGYIPLTLPMPNNIKSAVVTLIHSTCSTISASEVILLTKTQYFASLMRVTLSKAVTE